MECVCVDVVIVAVCVCVCECVSVHVEVLGEALEYFSSSCSMVSVGHHTITKGRTAEACMFMVLVPWLHCSAVRRRPSGGEHKCGHRSRRRCLLHRRPVHDRAFPRLEKLHSIVPSTVSLTHVVWLHSFAVPSLIAVAVASSMSSTATCRLQSVVR